MKKILSLILLLVVSFSLYGCKQEINDNVSVKSIMEMIIPLENFENGLLEDISNKEVAERYGILPDDIEEGFVYSPYGEERSDKVIIVKSKSKSEVEDLERALSAELVGITDTWKNDENESKKIENHLIKTKDTYIILYIGENYEQIENIFDDALNLKK